MQINEPSKFLHERKTMVSTIKKYGVKDEKVLSALLKVPRHLFVENERAQYAYADHPLPIGYAQTISQPYIVAFMTEAAQLDHTSRVLEIGTGSGYQAAILGEICNQVFTIEVIKELADRASRLLASLGYTNIQAKIGNGYEGWTKESNFDAIIVTAAAQILPEALLHQLSVGGRMIIPLQNEIGGQNLVKIIKTSHNNDYESELLLDVIFVPMVQKPY